MLNWPNFTMSLESIALTAADSSKPLTAFPQVILRAEGNCRHITLINNALQGARRIFETAAEADAESVNASENVVQ